MSAAAAPLLVELLVEELPPKALRGLGIAFADALLAGLRGEGLAGVGASATPYATPRRLAVLIDAVAARAADRAVSLKLMPATVGLTPAGEATPALAKRLAALGADASVVSRLQRRLDGKSETLFLDRVAAGAVLAEALQQALDQAVERLPIPKVMEYQLDDGWTSVKFVRPAHGLVALHGSEVVPVSVLGLQAGRSTRGHRFEAAAPTLALRSADSYVEQLRDQGAVIAGFDERRAETARQLVAAADEAGLAVLDDGELLDEVTALVERPNVLACEFDPEFLQVPAECLILTMKANQKYFPLVDAGGALTNRFLVVSNISPADPGPIIEGNERVIRPRLADAKFFFDQDRRTTLASRVPGLDRVVYHARLGSQGERVLRLRTIARWLAPRVGADVGNAERAAELAKADLLTGMVGEFPELQGIMGGYYAANDGEPDEVARALHSQYLNRRQDDAPAARRAADPVGSAEDAPPAVNLVLETLILADRAETLVGIWGIGLKPTGDKDPYALRRHALTVIGSLERLLGATLRELLEVAASTFPAGVVPPETIDQVETFVYERHANQLATRFDARAVDAVLAQRPPLQEVAARLQAVRDFQRLDAAAALAAANKRVANILRKSGASSPGAVDPALLAEPAELALQTALDAVVPAATASFERGDYAASLQALAGLRGPVDAFFDSVMVNADDPALRANRLALLGSLHAAMNRVADLSRLAA